MDGRILLNFISVKTVCENVSWIDLAQDRFTVAGSCELSNGLCGLNTFVCMHRKFSHNYLLIFKFFVCWLISDFPL